jgi:hypothetical protein
MDQDPTQTNSEVDSDVQIKEHISKHTLNLVYLVGGISLLVALSFFLFTEYVKHKESLVQENAQRSKEELAENFETLKKPWSQQEIDSTQAALDKFVSEIDLQINASDISASDKKKLLLSKAMALGTARSEATRHDNVLEAAGILNSLYRTETTNTDEDVFKYAVLSSYMSMLHSTCYYPRLGNMLPKKYSAWYKELLEKENLPEKQALILVFDRFVHEANDPRYWNDSATAMNRAYLLALYFQAYGTGVDPATLDQTRREPILWNKLKASVALGTSTKPILVGGVNRGIIDPAFRYAFAFDVLNTYLDPKPNEEINFQIDSNYERVFDLIKENSNQSDVTSTAVANILNSVFYIESMHRRYGVDAAKVARINEAINIFIENVSYNADTKALYSGYFLEGTTEDGKWMPVRKRFIDLANEYPKLDKFFSETFGID